MILGVAAVLATLAGAKFIIAVVAGPTFVGSAPVLQILGVAMLASFLTAGWGFALISIKRYRGLLLANGAALVVSCVLTLTLASTHGARGAAIATLCGEVTLSAGSLLALLRGHPEYRPALGVAGKVALAAAPGLAIVIALNLTSFVSLVLALVLYGLLILLTKAAPRELLELVPGLGRNRSPRSSTQ